jgi:hypothetical protein
MHDQDVELMFKYARELTYAELEKEAVFGKLMAVGKGLVQGAKDIAAGGMHTPVGTAARTVKTRVTDALSARNAAASAKQQAATARVVNRNPSAAAPVTAPKAPAPKTPATAPSPPAGTTPSATTPQTPAPQAQATTAPEQSVFDKPTGIEIGGKPVTWGHAAGAGVLGATGLGTAYVLSRAANTPPPEYPQEKAAMLYAQRLAQLQAEQGF